MKKPAPKRKDKAAVTDEVWTDERIKLFLDLQPVAGENADFHRLLKAYHSMRSEEFEKFIAFFKADGGDINACNEYGQTVAELIADHAQGGPYIELLK